MSINSFSRKIQGMSELLSGKDSSMGLSSLENKLFDSVEFCLALLGTIPVPIYVVDKTGKTLLLNSGRLSEPASELYCSHFCKSSSGQWVLPSKPNEECIFCQAVFKARETSSKVTLKGEWKVLSSADEGARERSLIVAIHAVPATIKDECFVLVAIEDLTEVEKLKGLLPICMECNKIHDESSGAWIRIDQYVTDRSAAKFSHGLCPECAERLLKEIGH